MVRKSPREREMEGWRERRSRRVVRFVMISSWKWSSARRYSISVVDFWSVENEIQVRMSWDVN